MRTVFVTFLLIVAFAAASACAAAPPSGEELLPDPLETPEYLRPLSPDNVSQSDRFETPGESAECFEDAYWDQGEHEWLAVQMARFHDFTSRNSQTHGRSVGLGKPLRGTSWLNRPYEASVDFGAFLMTGRPATDVRASHDKYAAVSLGWDWDHYWGAQTRLGWTTPELDGSGTQGSDNLFLLDVSLLYYPWGDSRVRPYWRMGMGLTDIEFINLNGVSQQEYLFTIPFGIGMKHQFRRWLVGRIEIVDNLAFGMNEANTMNNFTLTAGIEARFGGNPGGYWAWQPRGYAW